MTAGSVLLPLRIPELGPSLGRVIVGSGRRPGGIVTDAIRLRLATRIIEAAGEARRLAAKDEREAVVATLGRAAWFAAWEEAVAGVTDAVAGLMEERVLEAGRRARMSSRRVQTMTLSAGERRALSARLGSCGAGLIKSLDRLDGLGRRAQVATGLDRQSMEQWHDGLATAARRLEAAWLALEDSVEAELASWQRVVADVAAWRKPLWPVAVFGVLVTALAVMLGLIFGGYVTAPGWFADLWELAQP